jgi:hypothetical protein
VQALTGFTLTLIGYDASVDKITDGSGRVALVHASGEEAATWKFTDLMAHWTRKHPLAAYVPSMHEKAKNLYRYGPTVRLGEGTDFLHFLRAMSEARSITIPASSWKIFRPIILNPNGAASFGLNRLIYLCFMTRWKQRKWPNIIALRAEDRARSFASAAAAQDDAMGQRPSFEFPA